ncbi:hypothetical protein PVAND_017456 [Polypedilum vanderplanki]|uniref:Leucine rich repeat protein n=1 Tax=Polypedilum vanderplanki TaxID=319348 RepID=A0A9J6BI47_POLVA|nr:hypothetical protein PVAND_017456 [Polypedilum vanderplanki]
MLVSLLESSIFLFGLILFLTFVSIIQNVTPEKLECFAEQDNYYNNDICICNVESKNIFYENLKIEELKYTKNSNCKITEINAGFSFDDNGTFTKFPTEIQNFEIFKSVQYFCLIDSALTKIHQNDLKIFPHLIILILDKNKIEFLEKNLFEFNPQLKKIIFESSSLKHVDPSILSNLNDLQDLRIGYCRNKITVETTNYVTIKMAVDYIEKGVCSDDKLYVKPNITGSYIKCQPFYIIWKFQKFCLCEIKNPEIFNQNQTKIKGYEMLKDDESCDITGIAIFNSNLTIFPKDIEKCFRSIINIYFNNTNLQEIHQSDLQYFPRLVTFFLNFTKVDYLEADLFKFNPKLQSIIIKSENLKHAESKIFNNLKELEDLTIGNCKNSIVFSSGNLTMNTKEIVKKIENGACSD